MSAPRRTLNSAVTGMWSFLSPAYDLPFLQHWVYRPPHDEVIAQLRAHQSRKIADIACGTGILSSRIARELHPEEIYGVDMSDGMLAQARAKSDRVHWLRSPAEQLPFEDGTLDAVVTTSAFHFFDQPAALHEFHRVLAAGGLLAVATLSARQHLLQRSQPLETAAQSASAGDAGPVRRRRIHRQRPAPHPPSDLDPDHFGSHHGRDQKLGSP